MSNYGTYGSVSSNNTNPFGAQPTSSSSPSPSSASLGDFSAHEVFGSGYVGQAPQEFESIPISSSSNSMQRGSAIITTPSPPSQDAGVHNPFAVPEEATQANPGMGTQGESLMGLPSSESQTGGGGGGSGGEGEKRGGYPWHIEFYQTYFNVESTDVVQRIFLTVMPWKFNFFSTISTNPDIYGPFWTTTTLIFIISVSSDLRKYFLADNTNWSYDITKITAAAAVMYCYTILLPLIIWLVLKCMDANLKLIELICLYGYAIFIFIPGSLVCTFTYEIVKWASIITCASFSGFFLLSNIFALLKATHMKRSLIVLLVLGAIHAGLALTFIFYFFG